MACTALKTQCITLLDHLQKFTEIFHFIIICEKKNLLRYNLIVIFTILNTKNYILGLDVLEIVVRKLWVTINIITKMFLFIHSSEINKIAINHSTINFKKNSISKPFTRNIFRKR